MRKNWIDNLRWLMVLLFLLTGISARYSLDKRSQKEFRKSIKD